MNNKKTKVQELCDKIHEIKRAFLDQEVKVECGIDYETRAAFLDAVDELSGVVAEIDRRLSVLESDKQELP